MVEEHLPLRSPVVYEVVRQEGENELARPFGSLWWSGVAAGIAILASVLGMAVLHRDLPERPWRVPVEALGYTLGFVIVVLGRLQLFTENTVTAVLPLLAEWSRAHVFNTLRLWVTVLGANLVGTTVTAALIVHAGLFPATLLPALLAVAGDFAAHTPWTALMLGLPAGFLIATVVWVLPSAAGSELGVIVLLTWLIGAGGFTHVVVGSGELAILVLAGDLEVLRALALFAATLLGNIIGGTGLFALLAWGQVRAEF
ncbi:MAG: formate/nitrite transporter family protein [Gammaproteobacteria bacterium]|nr:formate/nitrite transporter family protein [Gammaproteobacteria bacterium]MCP5201897.1 formate/nitrite transporter family protein [Gammaproteobacteria bacterium]